MKSILNSTNPLTTVIVWGLLGGLSLIFIAGRPHTGVTVISIFGIALVIAIATVKLKRPNKTFLDLFLITLFTYLIMTAIDYVYIITTINPHALEIPFLGHLWRIGAMLGIGGLVSLVLTFLATLKK
jgi:hypothetical protein